MGAGGSRSPRARPPWRGSSSSGFRYDGGGGGQGGGAPGDGGSDDESNVKGKGGGFWEARPPLSVPWLCSALLCSALLSSDLFYSALLCCYTPLCSTPPSSSARWVAVFYSLAAATGRKYAPGSPRLRQYTVHS